jgi:hypothetical protein
VNFAGSNPALPTLFFEEVLFIAFAKRLPTFFGNKNCGSSSVGRASAFQAECREFDPRLPLHKKITKVCSFVIFFIFCRLSSAVECFLGKEEVTGSIPVVGSFLISQF